MQALKKTPSTLAFSIIACLAAAACDRPGTPTEPLSSADVPLASAYGSSSSTVRWVNDDDPNGPPYAPPGTSCNNPGYPTIQSAVTAANPGDRINVCPGLYEEQVIVPSGKDNIKLISVERWKAVIKAPLIMLPAGGGFAIVRVTGAKNVTILSFRITGPGPGPCNTLNYGVRVENAGSANILGNHITKIRDEPFSGCQNGVAIQVGRQFEATTGRAWIIGNVIDEYQKNGMTIDNDGSSAEIAYNRVLGIGPTIVTAQNGIQVGRGATANSRHNFVARNVYSPGTVAATGFLLFDRGKVVTERNTVTSNDVGIYMQQVAAGSRTTNNRVRASTYDGIIVFLSNSIRVAQNKIERNAGPGIGVYDAQNNGFDDNKVEDNDDSGILLDNASNNIVSKNQVRDNGTAGVVPDLTDGIRVNAPSTLNTIRDNRLKNNVTHDCHDGSAGNIWTGNRGQTSFGTAVCKKNDKKRDDDDDNRNYANWDKSTANGWDAKFAWQKGFGEAGEFDWAAAYAGIDTESLLQLAPAASTGAVSRASTSPAP